MEIQANGLSYFLMRERKMIVPRFVVECLARATEKRMRSDEVHDDSRLNKYEYTFYNAVRYPFVVVKDENPKGKAWLQMVLNQERI